MLVHELDMFPIECVVRGYLVGLRLGRVPAVADACAASRCRPGSTNGDRLPEPIYTPASKAPMGEHDENITFERTVELVGRRGCRRAARR